MIKHIIHDIVNYIENKKLTILYGSGLSRASGVPLAKEIVCGILSSIKGADGNSLIEKDVIDKLSVEVQMEDFLNRIYDDINIQNRNSVMCDLLRFYGVGRPNWNHYFLALLMKNDLVEKVLTTNIDMLLEEEYGDSFKDTVDVIYQNFNAAISGKPKQYIKLHGCYQQIKKGEIPGTILTKVSSKENIRFIKDQLKSTLEEGKEEKALVVLGYSCSDVYDITKVIKDEINPDNLNVYYIAHYDKYAGITRISKEEYVDMNCRRKNPFKKFKKGWLIKINTQCFLRQLYEELVLSKKLNNVNTYNNSILKHDISFIYEEWNDNISRAGGLPFYYSYQLAFRFYYDAAINEINRSTREKWLRKALDFATKCYKIAMQHSIYLVGVQLNQIASIYRELENYEAEKFYLDKIFQISGNFLWLNNHARMDTIIRSLKSCSTVSDKDKLFLQSIQAERHNKPLESIKAAKIQIMMIGEEDADANSSIKKLYDYAKLLCDEFGRSEYLADLEFETAKAYHRVKEIDLAKQHIEKTIQLYDDLGYIRKKKDAVKYAAIFEE